MPFRFPLAAVLRIRESIESFEERALQKIQVEIARTSRAIEALDLRIAGAHRACEEALAQSVLACQLLTLQWEWQAAQALKQTLLKDLEGFRQQHKLQMKVFQSAHRDREMLSDMQKKQRASYEQELSRRQQKYLDDIFISRRNRS